MDVISSSKLFDSSRKLFQVIYVVIRFRQQYSKVHILYAVHFPKVSAKIKQLNQNIHGA